MNKQLHIAAKHPSCGCMKYQIISINKQERTAKVMYKDQEATITFHECGEVDVDSDHLELEDIQDIQDMAIFDEELAKVFPCED